MMETETGFDHFKFVEMGEFECLKEHFLDVMKKCPAGKDLIHKKRWQNDCQGLLDNISKRPDQRDSLILAQIEIQRFLKWLSDLKLDKAHDLIFLFKNDTNKAAEFRRICELNFMENKRWILKPKATAHLIEVLYRHALITKVNWSLLHRILQNEFDYKGSKSDHLNFRKTYPKDDLLKDYEHLLRNLIGIRKQK